MKKPKRLMLVSVIDDGETVRLNISRHERIGDIMVNVYGQSADALSLPIESPEQWQRDMAVWVVESL